MASKTWRDSHTPGPWSNVVPPTIPLSTRRCVGCRRPLAKALLDVEPDAETHPCCTQAGPIVDWARWRVVQQARSSFALRSRDEP